MDIMQQEIQSVEQAIVSREWDGDLRKCRFDTDWQGRKNKNYKVVFHLKRDGRQVDLSVCLDYCQKPEDGGLCYSVSAKLMDGRNSGRFSEFERALKFFLAQVEHGYDDLDMPIMVETKKKRGRKKLDQGEKQEKDAA